MVYVVSVMKNILIQREKLNYNQCYWYINSTKVKNKTVVFDYLLKHLICSECKTNEYIKKSSIEWILHEIGKNDNVFNSKDFVCNHCKHRRAMSRINYENWENEEYQQTMSENKKAFWKDKKKRKNNINQIRKSLSNHTDDLSLHNFHNEISQKCRDEPTHFYIAKIKGSTKLKFGITKNIGQRAYKNQYGCYDFNIIKTFPNRIKCAYVEYKCRLLFGNNTEFISKNKVKGVIKFVKSIRFTKKVLSEIDELLNS